MINAFNVDPVCNFTGTIVDTLKVMGKIDRSPTLDTDKTDIDFLPRIALLNWQVANISLKATVLNQIHWNLGTSKAKVI